MAERKGFTLIEVLIVVLLVATLTTIAIPTFQGVIFKVKFAQVLIDVNAMEKSIDIDITEKGWEGIGVDFSEYIISAPQDFTYSIGAGMILLTDPPLLISFDIVIRTSSDDEILCKRTINCDGARKWKINESHPRSKYIEKLLPDAVPMPPIEIS